MSHELAQHDDEDARISRELSSDANQTGVVGAGGGGLAERTGLLGRDSAGDHSGLLGHFRSPSTAGLVVPSPALPDRTGLAGNLDDPDATNHSGLLGSSGIREREVR